MDSQTIDGTTATQNPQNHQPSPSVPSTLHDLLTARLDRLGAAKDLAQMAACIGREFDHALLASIASLTSQDLDASIRPLLDSGLVFRHGQDAHRVYSFKHALVRDAAYEGLLKRRRHELHARIAQSLANNFKSRITAHPQLLASHLTRAHLVDQALPCWRHAVRQAITHNRHREALGYVDAGLALVDQASEPTRSTHAVGLLMAGAACHGVLTGYACPAATQMLDRAEALLDNVQDQRLLILALGGMLISLYVAADTRKATAIAERLVALGEAASDDVQKIPAFALASSLLAHQGQFERCTRMLDYVVAHYAVERRFAYGQINDAKVHACVWLSWIHVTTGHLDRARRYAHMAVAHAFTVAEPFVLAQALSVGALAFAESGDYDEALDMCRRCIELCDNQALPFWQGWAMVHEGVVHLHQHRYAQADRLFSQAIDHIMERGGRNNLGYIYAKRVHTLALLQRYAQARDLYDIGKAECEATGQWLMLPELVYARGLTELLDPAAARGLGDHWLQTALRDAQANGMRLVALRAATALAALWADGERRAQGHAALATVLATFTEGFDGTDLVAARAMLENMASPGDCA
jgi:hypothetical protein